MKKIEYLKLTDLYAGELASNGQWVVADVETSIGWPLRTTEVIYKGRKFFLLPITRNETPLSDSFPALAIRRVPRETFEDAQVLIWNFLSALSWIANRGISVENWSGGNLPRPSGGYKGYTAVTHDFYEPYLPEPQDQNSKWALAFYREGLSINHVPYAALSFFKILNIFLDNGDKQKRWIDTNAPNLTDHDAKKRLRELTSSGHQIGNYLWVSGRCAIAHAGTHPTVDPENPADIGRLRNDLPLIKALAAFAIETHFGIKSSTTVYREHLYELAGFKEMLGQEVMREILSTGQPTNALQTLPPLSVRLWGHHPFSCLENMEVRVAHVEAGLIYLVCQSPSNRIELDIALNFKEERLEINTATAMHLMDDGTASSAKEMASASEFQLGYLMNGILEVWDSTQQKLLGRCDAHIPENIDMVASHKNMLAIIDKWRKEAERRQEAEILPPSAGAPSSEGAMPPQNEAC